jgi:hypothetical protein
VTPVIGRGNEIDYVARHSEQQRGNMKDQKKVPADSKRSRELDESSDVANEDDTKRLRTLTVQELERLLKDKKRD